MNGRQIEIFSMVMKTRTVSEAANRLGVSQPAVTASIKQIEQAIGFSLFHRKSGRLHPTQQARLLNREAERVQDALAMFRNLAHKMHEDLTHRLSVAAPPSLCHDLLPEAVARLMGKTKDCLIDVTIQHHALILQDIASSTGQNNLGFTFGIEDSLNLGSIKLGQAKIVALVPRQWGLNKRGALSITSFADRPLIGTFAGEPLSHAVEAMFHAAKVDIDYSIRIQNHIFAADLASRGMGAAIIDSLTARHVLSGPRGAHLDMLEIKEAPILPVLAVYSYEQPLNEHAKSLIQYFREALKRA